MYDDDYIKSFDEQIDNIETTISNYVLKIRRDYPNITELDRFDTYKYGNIALGFIEQYKTAMKDHADKDTKTNLINEIKSNYDRMNYKVRVFKNDFEKSGIVKPFQGGRKKSKRRKSKRRKSKRRNSIKKH